MEGANGTSINTNPPVYMCEVGTRGKEGIKRKKKHWNREDGPYNWHRLWEGSPIPAPCFEKFLFPWRYPLEQGEVVQNLGQLLY